MSKRFFDSEKFQDKWYRKLSCKQKCIWEYAISECDNAGFLIYDLEKMSFFIGEEITEQDLEVFAERFIFVSNDLIFIPKFILFQQKINSLSELNENNNAHKSILEGLRKNNIDIASPLPAPCQPLVRGLGNGNGKGNSNGIGKEKNNIKYEKIELSEKPDTHKAFGEYGNVYLTEMQRNEVDTLTMNKEAAIDLINDLSLNIIRNKAPVFNPNNPDIHIAELKAYWKYRQKNRVTPITCKKSAAQLVKEVIGNG